MRHDSAAARAARSAILIVDDHPIVRQGLTLLINREPDLAVCGDAEEAASALSRIEELKPDLIVVDISLNGPDGLDLLKRIRARDPNLPVLILSMLDESLYAERALRAGANGYIMKQEATDRVLVAFAGSWAERSMLATGSPTACFTDSRATPRWSNALLSRT
jgi:DNA-binding NarL/FixJ family response regulator